MNILFLSPPVFDFYFTPARREPLGLLYLKEAIKEIKGLNLYLYDSTLKRKVKKKAFPEHFQYLKKYYFKDDSLFSLFSSYKRFGDSFTKIINFIKDKDINLVAISSLFTGYHNDVEKLIKEIKDKTNTLIVVGGWAIEAEREKLFEVSKADFFIYGDNENNFKLLVTSLKNKKIPVKEGILYKKYISLEHEDASKTRIKPFSFEIYPQRENFYFFKGKKIAKVTLSKGCKFKCSFCAVHKYNPFNVRSFESIVSEFDYLLNQGVEIIDFEDDNLFFDKKWSEDFFKILKEYNKKGFKYTAMNGITAINLLPFTQKAIDSGFIEFNLSLVTSNKKTALNIHRPIFLEQIKKIAAINKNQIDIVVFLIAGLEENSNETLLRDIVELASLPVKIGFSPLYMLPDIKIFEKMGLPKNRDYCRGSALYKFGSDFTRESIVSIWKFVRMINAIKEREFDDELLENTEFFKKSIKEGVWYYKNNGKWKKSFKFNLEFPKFVRIVKKDNSIFNWYLF